jgi:NADH dehydrogenase (ubiquinone) Fe-S protein 1
MYFTKVIKAKVTIKVNERPIVINSAITIIQACLLNNLDIPRFCFHEKLKIAGNCRMCLVEVVKSVKPIAACATQVADGMVIKTNSTMVKKAREGVLEFLLANHPLDCPVCDQGGECDLQDQTIVFGNDRGRFYEHKRSVEDKYCGPFIKTMMTRCIHCTRCVRFLVDIAGISNLGVLGRGNSMSIGTYLRTILDSELTGNIVDLCPVGALTSKPYAFNARPWDLTSVETIDIFDSLNVDIRVDIKNNTILRILPRFSKLVNSN